MFNGYDRDVYTRINPLARQYVLNKLERRFQYNVTELMDTLSYNNSDKDIWSTVCTQLSTGIMSIIGHINYDDYDWLSGFCTTYQVPFLGLDNYEYIKNNYYISLMPDILPALVAFIRRYRVRQIVYLYDDTNGAHHLKRLMQMQTTNIIQNLNIISRYLGNPDDPYDLLQNIEIMTASPSRSTPLRSSPSLSSTNQQKLQGRYIVLDFHSFETYRIVMDKIKHRGMTTADYHYILLTLNAKQLDMNYFRYGGVNVTFFALPINNDTYYIDSLKPEKDFSVESLLLADAWEIILRTINHMLNSTNDMRKKFSHDIDCRNNYIQPWLAEKMYVKSLINTNFQGLTGNIQFSNITGERINYTLDVYRVTRNDMPKNIGFFQAPNKLEVELPFPIYSQSASECSIEMK
jgi:hypothetical protein